MTAPATSTPETPQQSLAALTKALGLYVDYTSKNVPQILARKGVDMSIAIGRRLKELMPFKGEVRDEREAAMRAGLGLRVRPSAKAHVLRKFNVSTSLETRRQTGSRRQAGARGKGPSTQTLAGLDLYREMRIRELAVRESGRGFTSYGVRAGLKKSSLAVANALAEGTQVHLKGRFSQTVGLMGLEQRGDMAVMKSTYGVSLTPVPSTLGTSMAQPRAQAKIALGINDVTNDILDHIIRQQDKAALKAFGSQLPTTQA